MGAVMLQGTGSDVGKSVLVAGLCRALANRGLIVRPFKSQNMSNNAAVTVDGGEIGRAQATQAIACRVEPHRRHEPGAAQAAGRPDVAADRPRHRFAARLRAAQWREGREARCWSRSWIAIDRLRAAVDIVVVEGAGSPAEINLRDGDIANMGFARAAARARPAHRRHRSGRRDRRARRHARGDRSRGRRDDSRASSSTSSGATRRCSTMATARSSSARAGAVSGSCRGSPKRCVCRARMPSFSNGAALARAAARSSPVRSCRASPISTISIRCGSNRRRPDHGAARSADPRRRRADHPRRVEGDDRRSRRGARPRLGHRHPRASPARLVGARPVRRLSDAGQAALPIRTASKDPPAASRAWACSMSRPILSPGKTLDGSPAKRSAQRSTAMRCTSAKRRDRTRHGRWAGSTMAGPMGRSAPTG